MFENSLMIIKTDYMHKRRPVLLKLLSEGFQIQTHRKINFSPELAAEFYADYADEKGFMLEVILLSKGTAEAFILAKEKAVQELLNVMICYFGSASEMERNMHVTKHPESVAREINFIFPNYIHEPTSYFDRQTFCNRPLLKPLIGEIYNLLQNVDCSPDNWKVRVADYLTRSNPALPEVTNQCTLHPDAALQDRSQQTTMTYASPEKSTKPVDYNSVSESTATPTSTSPHSSLRLSSTSCVTCGGFDTSAASISELDLNKRLEPRDHEQICVEDEIVWKEVIVYEEVAPEDETLTEGGEYGSEEYAGEGEGLNTEVDSGGSGEIASEQHAPAPEPEMASEEEVEPVPEPTEAPPPPAPAAAEPAPPTAAAIEEPPAAVEPPAEEPLAEESPAEEPPAEEPPAEEPPAEEPPADAPPDEAEPVAEE